MPQTRRMLALALDSPGGNLVEGEQLAKLIRARGLPVVIPSNSKCVSACFLLLAASPRRLAAADALVGVHSASEDGQETDTALAVTTLMARVAAEMGIPPAIIGKMVSTKAASVEWLTHADLASMDVTVFDGDTPAATRQANTAITTQIAPGPPPQALDRPAPCLRRCSSKPSTSRRKLSSAAAGRRARRRRSSHRDADRRSAAASRRAIRVLRRPRCPHRLEHVARRAARTVP